MDKEREISLDIGFSEEKVDIDLNKVSDNALPKSTPIFVLPKKDKKSK